jgi:hypothetical protein
VETNFLTGWDNESEREDFQELMGGANSVLKM